MKHENRIAGTALAGRPTGEDERENGASRAHTPAAVERASRLDAGRLRRHPARAHRVRFLIEGEGLAGPERCGPAPASWSAFVAVEQVVPGVRLRVAFRASRSPCACEECAAELWRRAAPDRFKAEAVEIAATALKARPWAR